MNESESHLDCETWVTGRLVVPLRIIQKFKRSGFEKKDTVDFEMLSRQLMVWGWSSGEESRARSHLHR